MKQISTDESQIERKDSLAKFALLSIAAALVTMGMKAAAYLATGSISLLSDAMESIVNLVGASFAFLMLKVAERPADADHPYGHSKAEYFASAMEAVLICVAAGGILRTAVERLMHPVALERLGAGLLISFGASAVNFIVARILIGTGKARNSITLEADGHHLLTDVWTSVAVGVGLVLVMVTRLIVLDPIAAILVAINILWTALGLLKRSVAGLMDASLDAADLAAIEMTLAEYRTRDFEFHGIRTRQAASRKFLSLHMLAKGEMSLHEAHHEAESLENSLRMRIPGLAVDTHLEPIEDEISRHGEGGVDGEGEGVPYDR